MDEPRLLSPDVWRRASRGLIAYGIVGLVVASIGLGSTVWVNGRINQLRSHAEVTLTRLASTTQLAATALRGASATATSFSGTLDQSAQAVSSATQTIGGVQAELSALEAQLRSVNFLGATPLASSADSVARIATSLNGLETQLPLTAGDLEGNRDALARNAASISALASSTDVLAARLAGHDSLDDVQRVIAITLLMFAAWAFVPAIGALALGLWLRRNA